MICELNFDKYLFISLIIKNSSNLPQKKSPPPPLGNGNLCTPNRITSLFTRRHCTSSHPKHCVPNFYSNNIPPSFLLRVFASSLLPTNLLCLLADSIRRISRRRPIKHFHAEWESCSQQHRHTDTKFSHPLPPPTKAPFCPQRHSHSTEMNTIRKWSLFPTLFLRPHLHTYTFLILPRLACISATAPISTSFSVPCESFQSASLCVCFVVCRSFVC